jgi:hypothetical protein
MRACIGILCVSVLFMAGCTKKAESPTASVQAPKDVGKIGVSPSDGLPLPPVGEKK